MEKPKVLFLCTENSARSQMAEALLKKYAGNKFDVYSAGLEPGILNPLAVEAMKEIGIDINGQYSKPVKLFLGKLNFTYIITLCDNAEKRCPIFPGNSIRFHWPFEDPAAQKGDEESKLNKFRKIRDQIRDKIKQWLKEENTSYQC